MFNNRQYMRPLKCIPIKPSWHYYTHIASKAQSFHPFATAIYNYMGHKSYRLHLCYWLSSLFQCIKTWRSQSVPQFCVPFYLICSILAPDHYLIPIAFLIAFPLQSIVSFIYFICVTYACFPLLHYISIFIVVILWLIVTILPII
jgi:hypothetical protein